MNNLERELSSIKGLQKKDIQAVTAFLVERELSSLGHVDLKTLTDYYSYVVKAFFQKAKQNHYGALLREGYARERKQGKNVSDASGHFLS